MERKNHETSRCNALQEPFWKNLPPLLFNLTMCSNWKIGCTLSICLKDHPPHPPPFKSHRLICRFRCLHCMCAPSRRQDEAERCLRAPIWICILTLQKHTTATPACNGASAASIDARPAPKSLPSAKRCHASSAEWWSQCRWKLRIFRLSLSRTCTIPYICMRCFTNLIIDDMIRYGHIIGCPALLNIDDMCWLRNVFPSRMRIARMLLGGNGAWPPVRNF